MTSSAILELFASLSLQVAIVIGAQRLDRATPRDSRSSISCLGRHAIASSLLLVAMAVLVPHLRLFSSEVRSTAFATATGCSVLGNALGIDC